MESSSCCSCSSIPDFEKLCSCTANGIILVTKYISNSTGLTIVHADIEGPVVSGYICVPTRASDDDGLPHTLEHLVFLGSETYPYSGVLDRLANKCLASGTNAWTDVDHTCYTLSTAGSTGFYQLLPIFMDHILFPLLTDAAFKTEVYHVGGRGNDAGVIYSEIMALENTSYCRATESLYKRMYPADSGYRWNVGGALLNLRESCNNEKVKAFHKKYYHPSNICVVISGKVSMSRVFRCLIPVIKKIHLAKSSAAGGNATISAVIRPWLTEERSDIPDIPFPEESTVLFSSVDEEGGCLATVGFLGPSIVSTALSESYALQLLLKYLTKSACAPLQQDLIERTDVSLATSLDFNAVEYSRTAFTFEFEGVTKEDKRMLVSQLRKSLATQVTAFDMSRMEDVIKSAVQAELSLMENAPHAYIAETVIKDFLYGNNDYDQFERRLNKIRIYESLLQFEKSFWTCLIQSRILFPNWVAIFAEPSHSYMKELAFQEETRVLQRIQILGESGIVDCMHQLDDAILQNERPIPEKILKSVTVPSIKCIQYYRINRIMNPGWVPTTDFPATLCLDDIFTSFVYVGLLMDTSKLRDEFRPFLPLFKEVLLSSPVFKDGASAQDAVLIPFEEVCARREKALQVCELDFGLELDFQGTQSKFSCGSYSHILALGMQMEMGKVEEGFSWIRRILWSTFWTMERIMVAANKLIADIHTLKRDGNLICQTIVHQLVYKENSNVVNISLITQLKMLLNLGMGDDYFLAGGTNYLITTAFNAILQVMTEPTNISLHIAANVPKLREQLERLPCKTLGNLLKSSFPFHTAEEGKPSKRERAFANFPDTSWMLPMEQTGSQRSSSSSVNLKKNHIIFASGVEDSSYMTMVTPGPTSYQHADLPALLTTLQYFTQQEGPLYRRIRGEGYAYSYNVFAKVNEGLIYFHLYRCADLVGAYAACLSIVADHLSYASENLWSEDLLVSARSSLIFECLETERTPLSLAANSCLAYYRNVSGTYIRDLIGKVAKVKMKDVQKMTKKYLDVLFHCPKNNYATVVVCPTDTAEFIQRGLDSLGKPMRIVNSFEEL